MPVSLLVFHPLLCGTEYLKILESIGRLLQLFYILFINIATNVVSESFLSNNGVWRCDMNKNREI